MRKVRRFKKFRKFKNLSKVRKIKKIKKNKILKILKKVKKIKILEKVKKIKILIFSKILKIFIIFKKMTRVIWVLIFLSKVMIYFWNKFDSKIKKIKWFLKILSRVNLLKKLSRIKFFCPLSIRGQKVSKKEKNRRRSWMIVG